MRYIIVGNESILSLIACAALKKFISLVTHIKFKCHSYCMQLAFLGRILHSSKIVIYMTILSIVTRVCK